MSQLFGKAVHAGFVVPDIDRTIERLLASGIGPVFVMGRMRVPARYRGKRHDPLITAVFVNSGNMQFEFVAQHDDTPSAYHEFIGRNPGGGLHHLAYFCPGFDAALKGAADHGKEFRIVQEFITAEGAAYEIYTEPADASDPLLMQLMMPGPMEPFFAQMEKVAASWDGRDPVRDALALLPPEMRPPVEPRQEKNP